MESIASLWLLVCTALLATLGLAWRCAVLARARTDALAICAAARDGEARVTRCLQLFAHDLQALALTLRGHADHLSAERHDHAPAVAVVAAQLAGLADELGHHLIPAGTARVLDCSVVDVAALVDEAVEAVTAGISPGLRHWRIAPHAPAGTAIWADHRALRLVMLRVLGEAVRSSGHNDWIDIAWAVEPDGLCLRIEDEGAGTAASAGPGDALANTPGAPLKAAWDSRGIGLRLSLARTLAEAHGGSLEVEAQARIGTRVTITLPLERMRPAPVEKMHPALAERMRPAPALSLVQEGPHTIASQ